MVLARFGARAVSRASVMEFGDIADLGKLVSGGGAVALAIMVWLELREHRKELSAVKEVIGSLAGTLTKISTAIEQREIKEFIREEISGVHGEALPPGVDEDVTPIDSPIAQQKKKHRTPPGGYQIIKPKPKE
jgi:hypothetical protein